MTSQAFDPYHRWLGIPPQDQPPNHYRLLGIQLFEDNPAVIEAAADRQMGHLRGYQTGKHAAESQELLNEVAAAKVCLLNPDKRAAYDERLRQKLQGDSPESKPNGLGSLDPKLSALLEVLQPKAVAAPTQKNLRSRPVMLIGVAALLSFMAMGLAIYWGLGDTGRPSGQSLDKEAIPLPPLPQKIVAKVQKPRREPTAPKASEATELAPPQSSKPPKPQAEKEAVAPAHEEKIAEAKLAPKGSTVEKPKPEELEQEKIPVKRIAPPTPEEQKRIIGEIDEVYKPGDAKDHAAKVALARKLLEDGRKNEANRAEQFVLLRRAGEIARDVSEADLMLEAVDVMAEAGFEIQPYVVKARWLKQLVTQAPSGDTAQLSARGAACVKFAEAATADGAIQEASDVLDTAQDALAEPRKQAQKALRAARTAVARTRSPADKAAREKKLKEAEGELEVIDASQSALAEYAKGLQQARQEQEAISVAQERLKTQPDDPDACLAVGRWQCFYQGDWGQGLRLLAKGSDDRLKTLAKQEVPTPPTQDDARLTLADAWWDLGQTMEPPQRPQILRHAGTWYEKAGPNIASELVRAKVRKRLEEIAKLGSGTGAAAHPGSQPINVLAWVDLDRDRSRGDWTRNGVALSTTQPSSGAKVILPLMVEGDYDLLVRFTRHNGGHEANGVYVIFPVGSRHCMILLMPSENFMAEVDHRREYGPPVQLATEKTYAVLIKVRVADGRASIETSLNESPLARWEGKEETVVVADCWRNPKPQTIGIVCHFSVVTIESVQLRLISGKVSWVSPDSSKALPRLNPAMFAAPLKPSQPEPSRENSSRRTTGGFPNINGRWRETSTVQLTITQTLGRFEADSVYLRDKTEVRWHIEGTITKDGRIRGNLVHTQGVTGPGIRQLRVGQLGPEGAIHGHASWSGGSHDFTWTRLDSN